MLTPVNQTLGQCRGCRLYAPREKVICNCLPRFWYCEVTASMSPDSIFCRFSPYQHARTSTSERGEPATVKAGDSRHLSTPRCLVLKEPLVVDHRHDYTFCRAFPKLNFSTCCTSTTGVITASLRYVAVHPLNAKQRHLAKYPRSSSR